MKKTIQRVFALSAVAGVAILMMGAADPSLQSADGPVELSDSVETLAPANEGDRPQPLDSCNLYKAREMCCPIWCAGKGKSVFDAAKALSGCARGYSCDWDDSPSHASFQCDSACK